MPPKRPLPADLVALLTEPLALRRFAGSGDAQAPLVVDALCAAGLRAVHQVSPPGVAVYVEPACTSALSELPREHALMWAMCGLASDMDALEDEYMRQVRVPLLARRLSARLRQLRPAADLDEALRPIEEVEEETVAASADEAALAAADERLEARVRRVVVAAAVAMDVAELQIEREWAQLVSAHSSLCNACLSRFLHATGVHVQDASLITSPDRRRVRIAILLYDAVVHEAQQRPRRFAWAPCLVKLVAEPSAEALSEAMVGALWRQLTRAQSYHPPADLVAELTPPIRAWFASCLKRHGGLGLRAALTPQHQLCFYLHGAVRATTHRHPTRRRRAPPGRREAGTPGQQATRLHRHSRLAHRVRWPRCTVEGAARGGGSCAGWRGQVVARALAAARDRRRRAPLPPPRVPRWIRQAGVQWGP
jgi:hypothetical protein